MKVQKENLEAKTLGVFKQTLATALSLPVEERTRLAEQLLESLQLGNQEEIDDVWAIEIENRVRSIDEGKIQLIPGDEVIRQRRSKFA